MGDRAQIGIKQQDGGTVWLYTHWAGSETPKILAEALGRRARWTDEQYLSRVIWDAMVEKHEHGKETGYGITTWPVSDANHPFLIVDTTEQRVTMHDEPKEAPTKTWTFEEFLINGADAFAR